MADHQEILLRYFPPQSIDVVYNWVVEHHIHFRITKSRESKLGDYQPLPKINAHRITVNFDLNKWAFLIIFVHELAHLVVYETHGNKVKAHGNEWKNAYRDLMKNFTGEHNIFPPDIAGAVEKYMAKAYATSYTDVELTKILRNYNKDRNEIYIDDIPMNGLFKAENGEIFRKEQKLRKRFLCVCIRNRREYFFSPMTRVFPE